MRQSYGKKLEALNLKKQLTYASDLTTIVLTHIGMYFDFGK